LKGSEYTSYYHDTKSSKTVAIAYLRFISCC